MLDFLRVKLKAPIHLKEVRLCQKKPLRQQAATSNRDNGDSLLKQSASTRYKKLQYYQKQCIIHLLSLNMLILTMIIHYTNSTNAQGLTLSRTFVEMIIRDAIWLESKVLHKMALLDDAVIAINMPINAVELLW